MSRQHPHIDTVIVKELQGFVTGIDRKNHHEISITFLVDPDHVQHVDFPYCNPSEQAVEPLRQQILGHYMCYCHSLESDAHQMTDKYVLYRV